MIDVRIETLLKMFAAVSPTGAADLRTELERLYEIENKYDEACSAAEDHRWD